MSKIDEISIVFPCEKNRVPLLLSTLACYQKFGLPEKVELVLVSRTFDKMVIPGWDIKVVKYGWNGKYVCPSMAFNLGAGAAKYKNLIIGHPEVKPINNALEAFFASERGNYVCAAYDTNAAGEVTHLLFGSDCRAEWPGLYFLALYRKEDIEAINGWDMRFMHGYSNEDIDFGQRMLNAGFGFTIRDDIIGVHQWHPRGNCSEEDEGWARNRRLYEENKENKVTWVANGLKEVLNGC